MKSIPKVADDRPALTVPLISIVSDPNDLVNKIIGTITDGPLIEVGLFRVIQQQLYENQCRASGVVPYQETKRPLVYASESDLPPQELIETYLSRTPFLKLLQSPVAFVLPQDARFEHHWIVGGSGHGKTNALTALIADDLQRVAGGEASMVVIDSQNALIPMIAHLPFFAKGGALSDKLVLIDASDVEYPVALNLFDVGLERLNTYSMLDRERLLNTAAEVMQFILASLLGACHQRFEFHLKPAD